MRRNCTSVPALPFLRPSVDNGRLLCSGSGQSRLGLLSRCLTQSRHWITRQRGGINDRYQGAVSNTSSPGLLVTAMTISCCVLQMAQRT